MKLKAADRKKMKKKVIALTGIVPNIPLEAIDAALRQFGYWLIDEAGETLSCLLCGREGFARFDYRSEQGVVENSVLALTWYKMNHGWDVVAYLS